MKTIKELADELGVSKQAIQYHIKFLPTKDRQKTNKEVILLSAKEQQIIKERMKTRVLEPTNKPTNKLTNMEKKIIEKNYVNERIQEKNDEIIFLRGQVKELNNLLDQQQKLNLHTQNILMETQSKLEVIEEIKKEETENTKVYKKWWKFWE